MHNIQQKRQTYLLLPSYLIKQKKKIMKKKEKPNCFIKRVNKIKKKTNETLKTTPKQTLRIDKRFSFNSFST